MRIYSVSEFRVEINELLEEATVAIEGEISDFSVSQNRFVWFSLADDQTVLKCFMLAFQLTVPLEEGMQVRVIGTPTLFKKGQFVFRPKSVELVGEGTLKQAYELLKQQLEKEGLFDESRKRALPRFPQKIGLVTSKDAAAYTDVLRILNNRWAGLEIRHINVNVQGAQAVSSIVGALNQLNADESDLDCIILTRGGGSLEDLQAFNAEEVVRAIFASTIPIVCGVGHERDVTLSDFVADVRASTPSNAAEFVVPHKDDVRSEITHMLSACERHIDSHIQDQKNRIAEMISVLDQHAREHIVEFQSLNQRLQFSLEQFVSTIALKNERIQNATSLLHSLNPLNVLKRGYTMTVDDTGKIISSKKHIRLGNKLKTRFHDGTVDSTVDAL